MGLGSPNRPGPPNCCCACGITPHFLVTQSGVIPAQRNRAPPCQIVADAAFLERHKIGLKMLTHQFEHLLGSDNCPVSFLSVILGPLDSLIPLIFEFAQKSLPTQYLCHLTASNGSSISPIS